MSHVLPALRMRAHGMAVGDILGTCSLSMALFLLADVFHREGAILAAVDRPALYLAGLGMLITCLHPWGLLERRDRVVLRMGIDSLLVLIRHLGGMALLYSLG